MTDPKQRYSVTCWNCGGEGVIDHDWPSEDFDPCDICEGAGYFIVTELTEDNCCDAIPIRD